MRTQIESLTAKPREQTTVAEPLELISGTALADLSTTESSTERPPEPAAEQIRAKIQGLFSRARGEVFADGMDSVFSRGLKHFIDRFGSKALDEIALLIIKETAEPEVAEEALRWIGYLEDSTTHRYRRWILSKALSCSSVRVRDGALLGISFMDDPSAADDLRAAMKRERIPELRYEMGRVLEQLEAQRCPNT